jgi:hypothetical protein
MPRDRRDENAAICCNRSTPATGSTTKVLHISSRCGANTRHEMETVHFAAFMTPESLSERARGAYPVIDENDRAY